MSIDAPNTRRARRAARRRALAEPEAIVTAVDQAMMRRALELASDAAERGEVPVGAVVYREAEIIAEAANAREATHDPAGHAELVAMREAGRAIGAWRLGGCSLAVTLEPCPMCAGAAVNARLSRLVYGATDPKAGACETLYRIPLDPRLNHRVVVIGGVLATECAEVLGAFFERGAAPGIRDDRRTPMIDIVCFDLGGVVVRLRSSWGACCRSAGFDPPMPVDLDDATVATLVDDHQRGLIDGPEFARGISAVLDGSITPERVLAAHVALLDGEYEGIAALVDRIHAAGPRTACLSNTNHVHWEAMADYPTLQRLGTRLASHDLGLRKPEPAIYEVAAERLACAPERILFFDDLEDNVEAAQAAGWRAARIDPTTETTVPQIREHLAVHGVIVT